MSTITSKPSVPITTKDTTMKRWKTVAYGAVIVLAILAFGCIVWFSASYFFTLNAQVNQDTQNIQSIIQYINQHAQASPTPSTSK
jgi:multidrug resistance efflux pump